MTALFFQLPPGSLQASWDSLLVQSELEPDIEDNNGNTLALNPAPAQGEVVRVPNSLHPAPVYSPVENYERLYDHQYPGPTRRQRSQGPDITLPTVAEASPQEAEESGSDSA